MVHTLMKAWCVIISKSWRNLQKELYTVLLIDLTPVADTFHRLKSHECYWTIKKWTSQYISIYKEYIYIWLRYIDDIFFVRTHGEDKLDKFLERLDSFHPNLKFISERSEQKISFLDVTVQLSNNKFVIDLYCKPADCHQYLHYNSCHPRHMKKSSIYGQGLRIKRLCSEDTALANHLKDLQSWFCGRSYPENIVAEQLEKCNIGTGKIYYEPMIV